MINREILHCPVSFEENKKYMRGKTESHTEHYVMFHKCDSYGLQELYYRRVSVEFLYEGKTHSQGWLWRPIDGETTPPCPNHSHLTASNTVGRRHLF